MVGAHNRDYHPSDEGTERTGSAEQGQPSAKPVLPTAHALLEMKAESESLGSTCALLTPAIKSKLRGLDSGQVLEVRVNDPTAREDIDAWCRLSGNELLATIDEGQRELRFFLRKK